MLLFIKDFSQIDNLIKVFYTDIHEACVIWDFIGNYVRNSIGRMWCEIGS